MTDAIAQPRDPLTALLCAIRPRSRPELDPRARTVRPVESRRRGADFPRNPSVENSQKGKINKCQRCNGEWKPSKKGRTYPDLCAKCNDKQMRRDAKKRYRKDRPTDFIDQKAKFRRERRLWLEMTERRCPRCEEMKTERDFVWNVNTTRADVCIKCRGRISHRAGKTRRERETGKNVAKALERELLEIRRVPKWADRKMTAKVYEYARVLRDSGFDCHVDHIIPLRGELVSGLHVHNNLRVVNAVDNLSKGAKLVRGAETIPAEVDNPGFQDFLEIST